MFRSTANVANICLSVFRLILPGGASIYFFDTDYRSFVTRIDRPKMSSVVMENKGRVLIYSILGCPHCMRAKSSLQKIDLAYIDISLDRYPHVRDQVKTITGKTSVPQIFFNAAHVGGNSELQILLQDKERLAVLLQDLRDNEPPSDAPVPPDPSTAVDDAVASGFKCEEDEHAQFVHQLRSSGLIKDHRQGLHIHKATFSGHEFLEWVMKTKFVGRQHAIDIGQLLLDQRFGHNVNGTDEVFQDSANSYYRLLDDDESNALNAGQMSDCEPRPSGEIAEDIRRLILKLYATFMSDNGKKVNYAGIGSSSEFEAYIYLTRELYRIRIEDATREERLAFFINIYNALVIHANVKMGPPKNIWQRYKFFNAMRYIIAGQQYSLQDIENGVLRGNRKGIGMLFKPFSKSDVRLKVALKETEPLIHFALVCGAKSCPPIKTYSAKGIYDQLRQAAEAFLEGDDACHVDLNKRELHLSMIFKWYREDFGKTNREMAEWIHAHMGEGSKKSDLDALLQEKNLKVSHMPYDWGSNSSH